MNGKIRFGPAMPIRTLGDEEEEKAPASVGDLVDQALAVVAEIHERFDGFEQSQTYVATIAAALKKVKMHAAEKNLSDGEEVILGEATSLEQPKVREHSTGELFVEETPGQKTEYII